ncbi:MAG: hypothetical protein U0V48_05660 [Anaerolineales bacterium]
MSPGQVAQQMLAEALSPSAEPVERQAIVIDVMNGTSIPGLKRSPPPVSTTRATGFRIIPPSGKTTPTPC